MRQWLTSFSRWGIHWSATIWPCAYRCVNHARCASVGLFHYWEPSSFQLIFLWGHSIKSRCKLWLTLYRAYIWPFLFKTDSIHHLSSWQKMALGLWWHVTQLMESHHAKGQVCLKSALQCISGDDLHSPSLLPPRVCGKAASFQHSPSSNYASSHINICHRRHIATKCPWPTPTNSHSPHRHVCPLGWRWKAEWNSKDAGNSNAKWVKATHTSKGNKHVHLIYVSAHMNCASLTD